MRLVSLQQGLTSGFAWPAVEKPGKPRFGIVPDAFPALHVETCHTRQDKTLKPGVLLGLMDRAGALAAGRHSKKLPMATIALDRMRYLQPAQLDDFVSTTARVTGTSDRSVEVAVDVYKENLQHGSSLDKLPVANAFLTFALLPEVNASMPAQPLNSPEAVVEAQQYHARRHVRQEEQRRLLALPHAKSLLPVQRHEVLPGTTVSYQTRPQDANRNNTVFGGIILDLLHRGAERAAQVYAKGPVKVLTQDRMKFDKPGLIGDRLVAWPVVTWVSSDRRVMDVHVDLIAQRLQPWLQSSWVPMRVQTALTPWLGKVGHRKPLPIAHSTFLVESIDKPLPPLKLNTARQRLRHIAAESRLISKAQEHELMSFILNPDP